GEGGSGGELKLVGRDADSVFLMGNPSTVELSFSEANQFIGASLAVNISGQVTLNKPFTIGGTSAVTSIWLAADGHLTIGGTNALTVTQNSGFISPQTGSKITTNGTAGGGLNDYGVDNVSPFESNKTYVATIVDGFATWAELVA
ncbi:MAG: hypothetical protein LBN97_07590, partial [Oscillospiraceae bacterium]|nr:hypothetical protein [Oscillospiraceae bacterium]